MTSTTTYSPDVAPDLQPRVVRWQPRHPTPAQREMRFRITASLVVAGSAALVIGAVALGVAAVGRLGAGRRRFRALGTGDLRIGRLRRLRRPF